MADDTKWPPQSGVMAELIRTHSWHRTPLGPIEAWPLRLRMAVEHALDSAFGCLVFWGPEMTQVYNDAYIDIMRDRHPGSLGQAGRDVWKDVWPVVGEMLENVLEHGTPAKHEDMRIPIFRDGALEPGYFTFCYSALRDDRRIAGIYVTAIETTAKVEATAELRERESHQRCLLQLTDYLSTARNSNRILSAATRCLGKHLGAECAYFLEVSSSTEAARLSAFHSPAAASSRRRQRSLSELSPLLAYHLRCGLDLTVDSERASTSPEEDGAFIAASVQEPMRYDPAFLVVHGRADRVWSAQEEELVREVASRAWSAAQWARAEDALRDSEERFRGVYEHAPTGIAICDLQGRVLRCNPALTRLMGRPEEALQGRLLSDLVHPDHRAANVELLQAVRLSSSVDGNEQLVRYRQQDGQEVWVQRSMALLRGELGEPTQLVVLLSDITERKAREEQVQGLLREVNHRSKNLLSLVQALARATAQRGDVDFVERLQERLQGLAASQDLLVASEWRGATVTDLVRSQVGQGDPTTLRQVDSEGPPVTLSASAAQTLGMALHELSTNARKYGALSQRGRITLRWKTDTSDMGQPVFTMRWTERGGPPVQAPERAGYGLSVVQGIVEADLDAQVTLGWRTSGLEWQMRAPLATVTEGRRAGRGSTRSPSKRPSSRPGRARLLVVEDHALLARALTHTLVDGGFDVVGPCNSVDGALASLAQQPCQAAILDIHLGNGVTSEPVAQELRARGVPFAVLTGYSAYQLPEAFRGAPVLNKPVGPAEILGTIRALVPARERGEDAQPEAGTTSH